MSMSYENDYQMRFVSIGLEEGLLRGEARALCNVARRMKALGISQHAIATCLGVDDSSVDRLVRGNSLCDDFVELEFTKGRSDVIL